MCKTLQTRGSLLLLFWMSEEAEAGECVHACCAVNPIFMTGFVSELGARFTCLRRMSWKPVTVEGLKIEWLGRD
jgi:hypothetical protein